MSPPEIATASMEIVEGQMETRRERLSARVFGHVGLRIGSIIVLAILLPIFELNTLIK